MKEAAENDNDAGLVGGSVEEWVSKMYKPNLNDEHDDWVFWIIFGRIRPFYDPALMCCSRGCRGGGWLRRGRMGHNGGDDARHDSGGEGGRIPELNFRC